MKLWVNAGFMSVKEQIHMCCDRKQMGSNEEDRMVKVVCFLIRFSSIVCAIIIIVPADYSMGL